ncbi:MAG TPA: YraN family protein [bacterium]|nr:YraN family protein [bacterium]
MDKIQLGHWGENIAKEYLIKKGYRFLRQNIRIGRGEIDLLFFHELTYIVVEVKTKTSTKYGYPGDMIDYKKISQLSFLVEKLITKQKSPESIHWRIDAVGIVGDGQKVVSIAHYQNVTIW